MSLLATKAQFILHQKPFNKDRPKSSYALMNYAEKINNVSFEKKYNLKRLKEKWNRKIKLNYSFNNQKFPIHCIDNNITKSKEDMRLLTTPDILGIRKKGWDQSVLVAQNKLFPHPTSILSHKSIFDYDGFLYDGKKGSNSSSEDKSMMKEKNKTESNIAIRSNLRPISQQKPYISTKEFIMKLYQANHESNNTNISKGEVKKVANKKNKFNNKSNNSNNDNKIKKIYNTNSDDDIVSIPKIMRSSTMDWITYEKPTMSLIKINKENEFMTIPSPIPKDQEIKHLFTEIIKGNKLQSKSQDYKLHKKPIIQIPFSIHISDIKSNTNKTKISPINKQKDKSFFKLKIPFPKKKKNTQKTPSIDKEQKTENAIEIRLTRKSLYQKEMKKKLFKLQYTIHNIHPGIYRIFNETNAHNSTIITSFTAWSCCLNESKDSKGCSKMIEKRNPNY